ncbi:MAG TPA: DUF4232 domain-containing protein [Streptosporangiaceae bacterium]|nr:DUF4232 domain-containing protein [Streptosporangiaceae bacterium]
MRLAGVLLSGAVVVLLAACGSTSSGAAAAGSGSPAPATSPSSPAAASVRPGNTPTSGGLSPRAVPSVPPCATSGLKVTLGPPNGAAGSVYLAIDFTNTTAVTCSLYGYPGVSLADGNPPAQLGAAAARTTAAAPALVTLQAGGIAHATVQVTQAGNYPAATCDPAPATTMVIYPPGQTAAASVPYTATGCKSTAITILHVEVVQPGG